MKEKYINKKFLISRVNKLIAEETKDITANSAPEEMYEVIRCIRTDVVEYIKMLPTEEF